MDPKSVTNLQMQQMSMLLRAQNEFLVLMNELGVNVPAWDTDVEFGG